MSDGAMVMWGFVALISVIGVAGLLHERLRHRPAKPPGWSEAEHQHALIMSRYYAGFGPPD
jgi:hypothetical protein